jgi:hypothetical protein
MYNLNKYDFYCSFVNFLIIELCSHFYKKNYNMKVIDMLMCFSISRLMQAVGKLICGWQEERVIKTYVQKLKFNILQEMKYEAICVAINLTCQ